MADIPQKHLSGKPKGNMIASRAAALIMIACAMIGLLLVCPALCQMPAATTTRSSDGGTMPATSQPSDGVRVPKLSRVAATFLVADAGKALPFYRDKLGFEVDYDESTDFAIMINGGVQIFLKRAADPARIVHNRERVPSGKFYDAYMFTERLEDVDAMFERFKSNGVEVRRTDWGPNA